MKRFNKVISYLLIVTILIHSGTNTIAQNIDVPESGRFFTLVNMALSRMSSMWRQLPIKYKIVIVATVVGALGLGGTWLMHVRNRNKINYLKKIKYFNKIQNLVTEKLNKIQTYKDALVETAAISVDKKGKRLVREYIDLMEEEQKIKEIDRMAKETFDKGSLIRLKKTHAYLSSFWI